MARWRRKGEEGDDRRARVRRERGDARCGRAGCCASGRGAELSGPRAAGLARESAGLLSARAVGWAGVEEWRARGLRGWRAGWAAWEGRGRSGLGLLGWAGVLGSFPFLFSFSLLFLIQTKFEFKYKFEFRLHSNKTCTSMNATQKLNL